MPIRKTATEHQFRALSAFWREKQGYFLGYFFVWVPIFDPTLLQHFIQIPHTIFLLVIRIEWMMIWAKKKSPHFREKYLVLSYLNVKSNVARSHNGVCQLAVSFLFFFFLSIQRYCNCNVWHNFLLVLLFSLSFNHRGKGKGKRTFLWCLFGRSSCPCLSWHAVWVFQSFSFEKMLSFSPNIRKFSAYEIFWIYSIWVFMFILRTSFFVFARADRFAHWTQTRNRKFNDSVLWLRLHI